VVNGLHPDIEPTSKQGKSTSKENVQNLKRVASSLTTDVDRDAKKARQETNTTNEKDSGRSSNDHAASAGLPVKTMESDAGKELALVQLCRAVLD
jgi:hypothetical protein